MDGASQESTEPIDWDSGVGTSQGSQSQDQENQPPHFWGRFYPLRSQLSVIDLVENTVSFGKENTSVILTCLNLPRAVFKKCSKIHFEVQRKEVQCVGAMTTQVFIVDKSRNGTYINGHILSRRRPGSNKYVKLLKTNDVIGFPGENPGPGSCFRAYVYIDAIVSPSVPVSNSVQRKYQISLKLGAGAFGEVSLVFDKSKGKAYAMKTVIKERNVKGRVDTYKSKLLNELRILQTVNHPNIIKLVDVVDCPKEHCLILEYMEGKDLSYRIEKSEKLDEDLAKFYFWQITNGVQYLHSQGITHRDLKPANLLLSSSKEETLLKITDFGLSKVLSSATIMKTLCGTKLYVAPEVLFSGGTYEYTNAVDIWSMGVILYLCLSGTEPFLSESSNSVEDLIKEAAFSMPFQLWYSVSDHAQDLIRKMLIKEPGERIITDDILKDPWLQDDIMLEKIKVLYGTFEDNVDLLSNTFIGLNSTFSSTLEVTSQDETHGCSCPTNPPSKKFKRS